MSLECLEVGPECVIDLLAMSNGRLNTNGRSSAGAVDTSVRLDGRRPSVARAVVAECADDLVEAVSKALVMQQRQERSSLRPRSHVVLSIRVENTGLDGRRSDGTLHLVDLAVRPAQMSCFSRVLIDCLLCRRAPNSSVIPTERRR